MAAIGAACTRCTAPYLYRDPVVRTGETCCASVMTEYEKGGKKKKSLQAIIVQPIKRTLQCLRAWTNRCLLSCDVE